LKQLERRRWQPANAIWVQTAAQQGHWLKAATPEGDRVFRPTQNLKGYFYTRLIGEQGWQGPVTFKKPVLRPNTKAEVTETSESKSFEVAELYVSLNR